MKPLTAVTALAAVLASAPLPAWSQPAEAALPATPPAGAELQPRATAQAAPPAADGSAAPARWSLGAGVFGLSTGFALGTPSAFLFTGVPEAPGVQASLERSAGEGRWLVLGLAGSASRRRADVPVGTVALARDDSTSLAVSAGVRTELTRPAAAVHVSGVFLATAGYSWSRSNQSLDAPDYLWQEAWQIGATAGLAIDRELTPGLWLRVATPLLAVGGGHGSIERTGQPRVKGTNLGASLLLAPSLELRLDF
jgi:hypothetical protein